ncbi:unnamed protein product [Orchesella dallaii]|uniref:Uncharacterized protein n=1 Tax=Orchesella dallaii TaxID=48710 RepID=A0ABP1RVP4_9HEXA
MYIELVLVSFTLHRKLFSTLFSFPINYESEFECFHFETRARKLWAWNASFHILELVFSNTTSFFLIIRKFYVGDEYLQMLDVVLLLIHVLNVIPSFFINTVIRTHGSEVAGAINSLLELAPVNNRERKKDKIIKGLSEGSRETVKTWKLKVSKYPGRVGNQLLSVEIGARQRDIMAVRPLSFTLSGVLHPSRKTKVTYLEGLVLNLTDMLLILPS